MNRKRFFFKQKVTASQLRAAFDDVENAQSAFLRGFQYVGIVVGADVTETGLPNLSVSATGPATIYDQNFKHIEWSSTQTVNCALDETGNPTAVLTAGEEKWISIFAEFQTYLSDPRIDGNGNTVYYEESESFKLNVVQGGQAALNTAMRPAMRGTQILLADVKLVYGQTAIVNANIDKSRTQLVYDISGARVNVKARSLQEAMQQMVAVLNDFSGSTITSNAVSGSPYALPTGTLQSHVAQLLANENTLNAQLTALNAVPAIAGTPTSLTAGTIVSALTQLLTNQNTLNTIAAISDSPLSLSAGTIVNVITQLLAHINDDAALLARANTFSAVQTMNAGITAVGPNTEGTTALTVTGGGPDDGTRNTTGVNGRGRGNKPGIQAKGGKTGNGVTSNGGDSGGHGISAAGGPGGYGGDFTGNDAIGLNVDVSGGGNFQGIYVKGSGNQPGIEAYGGTGGGTGVSGWGRGVGGCGVGGNGGVDGHGVVGAGAGTGYGGHFTGGNNTEAALVAVAAVTKSVALKLEQPSGRQRGAINIDHLGPGPSSPQQGDLWFDFTTHELRFHNGTGVMKVQLVST